MNFTAFKLYFNEAVKKRNPKLIIQPKTGGGRKDSVLKVSCVHRNHIAPSSIMHFYQSSPNEWPTCTHLPKLPSLGSLSLCTKCERTSGRKNPEGEMICLTFSFFKKL